jgi:hypothetical protein
LTEHTVYYPYPSLVAKLIASAAKKQIYLRVGSLALQRQLNRLMLPTSTKSSLQTHEAM